MAAKDWPANIAELDLDLVCASYLRIRAPPASDGVDVHDLEVPTARPSPSPRWYAATTRCLAIRRDNHQLHYLRGRMRQRRPRAAEEPCSQVIGHDDSALFVAAARADEVLALAETIRDTERRPAERIRAGTRRADRSSSASTWRDVSDAVADLRGSP